MNQIISTCSFQEADVAFFPILSQSHQVLQIPDAAKDKQLLGVIEAPPIISQRLFLKNQNGKTFCCKNRPLEFSVFTPSIFTEQACHDYWHGLVTRMQKNHFPTIWAFMPEEAINLIFDEIIQGQGMFYAYKPSDKLPAKHYILAAGEKGLYSYYLQSPMEKLLSLN